MLVVKSLTTNQDWVVYHEKNTDAPETDYLKFNYTNATSDAADRFNDTAPTSVLFTVGSDVGVNDDYDYIAYLWTSIQGFSHFGTYEGN